MAQPINTARTGHMAHLEAITGLRGLAVALVFLSHSAQRDMLLTPWINFEGMGLVGVYAFFCLSAYLLTRKLLDNGYVSYAHYLMSRFFRIAPLYFLVLAGVYIAQVMTGTLYTHYLFIENGGLGLLQHLVFLRGDGIFWTMPVEFSFYLLLPLVLSMKHTRHFTWILVFLALIYFLVYYLIQVAHLLPTAYAPKAVNIAHNGQFLDVFLCGMVAACIANGVTARNAAQARPSTVIPIMIIAMFAFSLICIAKQIADFHQEWFDLRYYSIFFGVLFAATINWSHHPWLQRVLTLRILVFLGEISFSVYLLHYLIFQQINLYDLSSPVKFFLAAGTCVVAAWLARRYIETPGIALGNYLVKTRFPDFFKSPRILLKVFLDYSRMPSRI
jgi:peptidoglycan/LPS O-acetylase OafA/YrhL